jgi:hypothetical protein
VKLILPEKIRAARKPPKEIFRAVCILGIIVWLQGDPVAAPGNGRTRGFKGNRFLGDGKYPMGKSYRTICRKVYLKYAISFIFKTDIFLM